MARKIRAGQLNHEPIAQDDDARGTVTLSPELRSDGRSHRTVVAGNLGFGRY